MRRWYVFDCESPRPELVVKCLLFVEFINSVYWIISDEPYLYDVLENKCSAMTNCIVALSLTYDLFSLHTYICLLKVIGEVDRGAKLVIISFLILTYLLAKSKCKGVISMGLTDRAWLNRHLMVE